MKHQKKLLAILIVTAVAYKMPTLHGVRRDQTPLANTLGLPGEALGAGAAQAQTLTEWLNAHEDAQVVAASLLMIVGAWWLLRGILSIVINLALPLLIVIFAMVIEGPIQEWFLFCSPRVLMMRTRSRAIRSRSGTEIGTQGLADRAVLYIEMSVPQLRVPILGDSYPAVAGFLRTILLKLAEMLKTP